MTTNSLNLSTNSQDLSTNSSISFWRDCGLREQKIYYTIHLNNFISVKAKINQHLEQISSIVHETQSTSLLGQNAKHLGREGLIFEEETKLLAKILNDMMICGAMMKNLELKHFDGIRNAVCLPDHPAIEEYMVDYYENAKGISGDLNYSIFAMLDDFIMYLIASYSDEPLNIWHFLGTMRYSGMMTLSSLQTQSVWGAQSHSIYAGMIWAREKYNSDVSRLRERNALDVGKSAREYPVILAEYCAILRKNKEYPTPIAYYKIWTTKKY